ncbi:1-acyl-sn-glycerol-3-phosphate acyltransferase [Cardiobacteriaceae bacterium TAE3-ERU3]|nr:1-acyl-sn-glycerol-3-phosphate acyltransferase [Cardiobacteriaceae bacterium TAE3-ERU3]
MKHLKQFRRLVFTGLGYTVFGIGALLVQSLLPLLLYRHKGIARQLAARRLIARTWRWFLSYLRATGIIDYRYHGTEMLGKPGQLILANHPSLLDVLLLISAVPESNCIVKKSLQQNLFFGGLIRAAGYIPNNENEATLEAATKVLQSGETLLIFPEGTRTKADGIIHFNRAAVSIGLRAASEIRPVVVKMTPAGIRKDEPWYRIPETTYKYDIVVADVIDPQVLLAEKPLPVAARRLNRELINYFQEEASHGHIKK